GARVVGCRPVEVSVVLARRAASLPTPLEGPATRMENPNRSRSGSWCAPSVEHDAPDALALVHEREGAVHLLEWHRVRHEVVDLDAATHVPVDVLRQLGAAAPAAQRRGGPRAARDAGARRGGHPPPRAAP